MGPHELHKKYQLEQENAELRREIEALKREIEALKAKQQEAGL